MSDFVIHGDRRPIKRPLDTLKTTGMIHTGKGDKALQIVVLQVATAFEDRLLLKAWKERRNNRPAPVLLVVLHHKGVTVCGPTGDNPPVHSFKDAKQVERICQKAINLPNRHSAILFLTSAFQAIETDLPGINNEGLFAFHELQYGVPKREDWNVAKEKAGKAIGKRDDDLLNGLGYEVERLNSATSLNLLRYSGRRTALAVMLNENETPEVLNPRFNSFSPISYALNKADEENLSWVLLMQGERIRLYATKVDAGVGRRGRTETYIECHISLLSEEHLSYLWLIFSAEALAPDGSMHKILDDSHVFSGNLAHKLRDRIYEHVVPQLAVGIAKAKNINPNSIADRELAYEMALKVLFRLLFIAYAEDCGLLPFKTNKAYKKRSLKEKAQELARQDAEDSVESSGNLHWTETTQLWHALAYGNEKWDVPAYNGGLFSDDPEVSRSGAELAKISLSDDVFEQVLRHLLVIDTPEGFPGPVDFRSLGVREFGTVYEGLLESELAFAETNLIVDSKSVYKPANGSEKSVVVSKGEIYLQNRSGARKSSGSYYTKAFAVEHLLNQTLEPALDDHFNRLDNMNDTEASEQFFEFRVADIAMGSGHFLISAIDRIEKRMANYLAERKLNRVLNKLNELRIEAQKNIDDPDSKAANMEDGLLLRRMIARRCIYGVDLNSLAVELSRLAVWLHSFVPGLPLSFLDHNLVRGNALIGVDTISRLGELFEKSKYPLFVISAEDQLGPAKAPLERLANINDTSVEDITNARKAAMDVDKALEHTKNLFDLITARPISDNKEIQDFPIEEWETRLKDPESKPVINEVRKTLSGLHVLHFPIAFPEVFLRGRLGFDVIIGNPPWEKVKVEEHEFLARQQPGYRGMTQSEREIEKERLKEDRPDLFEAYSREREKMDKARAALVRGDFPEMGTGDPDLYKAFCWRFWRLAAIEGGRIGVVMPRALFIAKGSTQYRKMLINEAGKLEIVYLHNRAGWVFDEVHYSYTICLVSITRRTSEKEKTHIWGPFTSKNSFDNGLTIAPAKYSPEELLILNDTATIPLLPDNKSASAFKQISKVPHLELSETERGGGGEHSGKPTPAERWIPPCRKTSCRSRIRKRLVHQTLYRPPCNGTKVQNELQSQVRRILEKVLASVQGGVFLSLAA